MPRLVISTLVVLSLLGSAACSKKQEPASPPTVATTAPADADVPPPREFDFSGKSSNTGPASPASSVKTGQPQSTPPGTADVEMPVMVEFYPPFYPIIDRMKGSEGRVLLGLIVGETGAVESAEVISSTVPAYASEVMKVATQWRFIPAMSGGKAVRFPVKIPVSFISEFGSAGMPPGSPLETLAMSGDTFYQIGKDGRYTPATLDATPLTRVEPVYSLPEGTKEIRVVLKFRVDEQGRVIDPQVTESSESAFDQAALKAIRYWQFLPKLKNGKPVSSMAKLPLKISRTEK
jgi:TonB family protein